jgi:phosphoribosylanthranilate isomerase
MKNVIQVAGIIDIEEAKMVMGLGVEYLGFPLRLPVNKEDLTEDEAVEVIGHIPPPHKAVLITYLSDAGEIIDFCDKLHVSVVQLHGKIVLDELKKLKQLRPDIEVIKSLVVYGDNYAELEKTVQTLSPFVDFFITDTFDPKTGASGATGKTHDWAISRKLVATAPRPVILAGGINAANVYDAILAVQPAGVDVHTGIEGADGRKDPALTKQFVEEARRGFAKISG